jgi:hypothetical protein
VLRRAGHTSSGWPTSGAPTSTRAPVEAGGSVLRLLLFPGTLETELRVRSCACRSRARVETASAASPARFLQLGETASASSRLSSRSGYPTSGGTRASLAGEGGYFSRYSWMKATVA